MIRSSLPAAILFRTRVDFVLPVARERELSARGVVRSPSCPRALPFPACSMVRGSERAGPRNAEDLRWGWLPGSCLQKPEPPWEGHPRVQQGGMPAPLSLHKQGLRFALYKKKPNPAPGYYRDSNRERLSREDIQPPWIYILPIWSPTCSP